jgi:hypothetical protein
MAEPRARAQSSPWLTDGVHPWEMAVEDETSVDFLGKMEDGVWWLLCAC